MPAHTQHSQSDLNDALEHVAYELWKYKQSVMYYRQIMGDAALDFRVLHHRVLLEFFYGPPKHINNIVAWEYVYDWQNTHPRGNILWLDQYMTRCHTMLAHISTERSRLSRSGLKAWDRDWDEVEPHLDKIIAHFLHGLPPDSKIVCHRWFHQFLTGPHVGKDVLHDLIAAL